MNLLEMLSSATKDFQQEADKILGVVVGIVKDIRDPKGLGRIKVAFPWLDEESADTVSLTDKDSPAHSAWARIATLMAGKQRGSYFIPEVEDEVLVAFEHGEVDRPVIIGMLWNPDNAPPEAMDGDGKNDIRAIHSRSGHKVVFNDSPDNPSILIVDQTKENSIFIDSANNKMEIKVKGDLSIEVGGKITIQAKQDISAETKANLAIKATGSGTLETSQALTVKSSMGVTVDGSLQAEVKATTVSVNGSAMTEVKGGLVKIN